jgi:YbbR domain-containing protein
MKSFLTNNLGLKVVSIVLAVVSWYAIRETISNEDSLAGIPIQIRTAEGWAVYRQSDMTATVTFRGSQEDIRLLDRNQIKAVIDLGNNAVAGAMDVAVTPHVIRGVKGARIVRVTPEKVGISLDHEAEKKVPVKGRTTGKPFAGELEQVVCEPAVVSLRGPAQQLQQTEWVYTEPVDVEGRIEGFTKRRRVLPPSDSWLPKIDPPEVQVGVVIAVKTGSWEWKDVEVVAICNPRAPLAIDVTPARVNVIVQGAAQVLDNLKTKQPMAFVYCADLDPSLTYDLPVRVYLPPGFDVSVQAQPAFVHIVPNQ